MKRHYVLGVIMLIASVPFSAGAAERKFYLGFEAGQSRSEIETGNSSLVLPRGTVIDTGSDERDTSLGLYVGYTLSKNFAIEFAYSDFGESAHTIERSVDLIPTIPGFPTLTPNPGSLPPSFGGPIFAVSFPEQQQTTIDSASLSLSLVGRYPISGAFSFIGKAGLSAHRLESDLRVWFNGREARVIGGRQDESAGAALVGAGIEWEVHPQWHLRLQVQRHFMLEDAEFISNVIRGDVTSFTGGIGYYF